MISVEEALQQVLQHASPLGHEQLDLLSALGRVCAEDVQARRALPAFDNSAMDGYAVQAQDDAMARPVIGTIACGDPLDRLKITAGQSARIMTGAPLPEGADAVIMQEEAITHENNVSFQRAPVIGQHVRRRGSDVALGETVLAAGQVIGAAEIAACASQGKALLSVYRRPHVAILSTGNELVELDEEPGTDKIVNSNAYALAAMVKEAGAIPSILGIVKDSLEDTKAALSRGLFADVILTSGGVSVGEFDYVKAALDALGYQSGFWKINMKPGKPVVFGTLHQKPVLGLPGNPASCQVSFELFVRPLLLSMMGHPNPSRLRVQCRLCAPVSGGDRRHFVRAVLGYRDGAFVATPLRKQGSGELRSLIGANALLDIPAQARYNEGDLVTAIPYGLDW
jgi:molybdopterin molybdotransferase